MKHLRQLVIAIVLTVVAGALICGCKPTVPGAIDGASKALVGVDIALEEASKAWAAAVDAQIAICRAKNLQTPAEREGCLGIFARGKEVEPQLELATKSYDQIVEGLRQLAEAYGALRPYIEAAREAQD